MGIERFFSSIKENNITNLQSSFTRILENRISAKFLYMDFNSVIYISSARVLHDLNEILLLLVIGDNSLKLETALKDYKIELEDYSPQNFNKYIEEKLDLLILDKTLDYIYNALSNYIYPQDLEYLYIGIDGVPSKSKMLEQKKRRYIGAITFEIRNKIFKKYEEELKSDKNRFQYEKFKISWSRNKITGGTTFMHQLDKILRSQKFEENLSKICRNLKKYIYSGVYIPGEAEKKIFNHIKNSSHQIDNLLIYSPDADVTLLGLLLSSKLSPRDTPSQNIKILRYNQQKDNYNIIMIDILRDNIFNYIHNSFKNGTKLNGKLDKYSIINDIVLLLTIFGNDFVPKIESFNVSQDFNKIIDKYIQTLNHLAKYFIQFSKSSQKNIINKDFLLEIFKNLKEDEGGNLQKIYMVSHYRNYEKLKKTLNATSENFTHVVNLFLNNLRDLHVDMQNYGEDKLDRWSKSNDFINKLKKVARLEAPKEITNREFLQNYYNYFKMNNIFPKIGLFFRKYSKSLNDEFHQQKLEQSIPQYFKKKEKLTSFDKEIYKFENMLDEYSYKLNAFSLNLGSVFIDPKSLRWKTEKIIDGVNRYYKDFFNINDLKLDSKGNVLAEIIYQYIIGFFWVFEYYYNNLDPFYEEKFGDIWFYPHSHAPLVTQIHEYLKYYMNDNLTKNIYNDLNRNKVSRNDFFNNLEQLMYVSPAPLMKDIMPREYYDFIDNYEFYPDFKRIINDIWTKKDGNGWIDCRGALFLTKCHLNLEDFYWPYSKDLRFMKELRAIPLKKSTQERTGYTL